MMPRGVFVAILSLTVVGLVPGQPANADAPCPMSFTEPGHQRFLAHGGEAIVIDFEVTGAYEGRFYYGVAFAFQDALPPEAPTREGAIVSRIIEAADGALIDRAATRVYEEGLRAEAAGEEVVLAETPGAACGWMSSGGDPELSPGAYRMVVPGVTAHGSEIGALVPDDVRVVDVRVVSAVAVVDEMDCAGAASALTPMLRPTLLLDCRWDVEVPGGARAYWTLQSEARPDDPLRQATWHTADGAAIPVSRFVVGSGAAGDYALEVPQWLAPAGHLMLGPPEAVLPPDAGIAGVVAVVA